MRWGVGGGQAVRQRQRDREAETETHTERRKPFRSLSSRPSVSLSLTDERSKAVHGQSCYTTHTRKHADGK